MANEELKKIYNQVFEEVKLHPQIQGRERGLLYKTIQIILREEESQPQEKTQEICKRLDIFPNAYRDDDYKVVADLVEAIFIDRQALAKFIRGKNLVSNLSIKFSQSFNDEEEKMKWVVVTACTLVGVYFCIQYLKVIQQQKANPRREVEATKPLPPPPPPIPAALCLVIPAKIASTLKIGSSLSAIDVEHLIDNASYFLCTTNLNEQSLELLSDETISPDSNREVYIRVDISDGRDMLYQKIPYLLKTNLPTNAQFVIKKLACLKNLSGIEKFNRV